MFNEVRIPASPLTNVEPQKLQLSDLFVMQSGLRDASQIDAMIEFVRSGGIFDKTVLLSRYAKPPVPEPPLIKITRFEDGALGIHDGLHRAFSIWKAGRKILLPEEYEFEDWRYEDYNEINFANGWYTPFDPRREVRLPDLSGFKKKIREILDGPDMLALDMGSARAEEEAIQFIMKNSGLFKLPRTVWKIGEIENTPAIGQGSKIGR